MATQVNKNDLGSSINLTENNLLELQCLIKIAGISRSARCEIGRRQLLAFTTKHMDVGLLYQCDINCWPIIKRIPWYQSQNRSICALCFDPTGSWLLTATVEGSIYIIPILALVDDHHISEHKWTINDITPVSITKHQSSYCNCRPSALTWWQGVTQCSHVGILGTEEGEIIFINLKSGQYINSTCVDDNIVSLHICQDSNLEVVSLLITGKSQRQWRLILEQRMNGCIFSFDNDSNVKVSSPFNTRKYASKKDKMKILPSTRSRLQGLKQLSVEKLAILKQKLAETRSRNATISHFCEDSEGSYEAEKPIPVADASLMFTSQTRDLLVLEPLSEDMFLSPQHMQQDQSHLFTAYCANTNHITIHSADISVTPLQIYKMPRNCGDIILTRKLFFVTESNRQSLWVISCPLCKIKTDEDPQFNSQAVIAQFQFGNTKEFINNIYRASDYKRSSVNVAANPDKHDNKQVLATKIDDVDVEVPPVDTCIVVTNYGVYKVVFRKPLLNSFLDLALKRKNGDIEKAARLGMVFGMNVPQLFECAGDIHLTNGRFTEAALLYKLSQCRLLKGVLKTAAAGHISKLLECLNHCLTPPPVSELTTTMRIHLSNLTVFTFSELILRTTPQDSNDLYKHFLTFLSTNIFYDERWVVDVMGQTCLWKVLHHLTLQRGLHAQVLDILVRSVQLYTAVRHLNASLTAKYGLLICISEPSIIQAMLATPLLARSHMTFILNNLSSFQTFILQRLVMLYDPTNPAVRPLLIRYRSRRRLTSHSSQSSQCDSLDSSDMLGENESLVEELVETFLLVLLTLISKIQIKLRYNPALIGRSNLPNIEKRFTEIIPKIDFKRRYLDAGYGHVALIRNGNIYTWGNSSQGCLGTGPSISRYGPPQPVTVFRNMKIEILNVSCGRYHTLAVTNNGVYVWGGGQYGQLGLGRILQSPNPQLIVSLAEEIIVDAIAGQYHSVILTMDGRVFTWGWGVHGQLGHGDMYHKSVPTLVTSLLSISIRAISAGHAHTLTLSAEGSVFAFGCNIFGQLGIGHKIKSSLPIQISLLPEPINDIATGYFHNLAVSITNKVYIWGSSPQLLRLQTQAQKKLKLLEFQTAAENHIDNLNEFDSQSTITNGNFDGECKDELFPKNVSASDKLTTKIINERKLHYSNEVKNISLRDINLGLIEETQTHLKPALVDTSLVTGRIVQISTGCHHSALLTKDGTIYCWGRNFDGQIGNGTRQDVNIPTPLIFNPVSILSQVPSRSDNHMSNTNKRNSTCSTTNFEADSANSKYDHINQFVKAVKVCCGCEFTVAIQPGGTVLSWGSNSIAQLGRSPTKESGNMAEKLVLIKSSKRVIRLPHGIHIALDTPSQVPHIPTPIITYQSYDITPLAGRIRPFRLIEKSYGELTLHYALEQLNGLYNTAKIVNKCDELKNYQARSKLALLEQNFSIALAYQLKSLIHNNYYQNSPNSVSSTTHSITMSELMNNQHAKKVKENMELFMEHVEKNLTNTIIECESKKKVKMSISRSLDCIHPIEQELHTFDCQGGSEELCEDTKSDDISLDITDGALDNDVYVNEARHVSKTIINTSIDDYSGNNLMNRIYIPVKFFDDERITTNNLNILINNTLKIIKFYINEIDENAQKVWCEVLQTVFDFWITNNLPMVKLENLVNLHINKLFYPLGLLLLRQNAIKSNINANKNDSQVTDSMIINHLSTKFCLKISKMILRYIHEERSILEYVELFSLMAAIYYGPPLTEYPRTKDNKTVEQLMKGIISTISSKSNDTYAFIHIKDPDMVSRFLESEGNTLVFTCGHHIPISIYQSEVISNMEAELLMQPLSLSCTAQILGTIMSDPCKVEIMCPRCIPHAIQMAIKNLMNE